MIVVEEGGGLESWFAMAVIPFGRVVHGPGAEVEDGGLAGVFELVVGEVVEEFSEARLGDIWGQGDMPGRVVCACSQEQGEGQGQSDGQGFHMITSAFREDHIRLA